MDLFPNITVVVHCRHAAYDVYIGRPSKWGNPFSHIGESSAPVQVATREAAVKCYEQWILGGQQQIHDRLARSPQPIVRPTTEEIKRELKGKRLGCWCKPQGCHGDVLARIAES